MVSGHYFNVFSFRFALFWFCCCCRLLACARVRMRAYSLSSTYCCVVSSSFIGIFIAHLEHDFVCMLLLCVCVLSMQQYCHNHLCAMCVFTLDCVSYWVYIHPLIEIVMRNFLLNRSNSIYLCLLLNRTNKCTRWMVSCCRILCSSLCYICVVIRLLLSLLLCYRTQIHAKILNTIFHESLCVYMSWVVIVPYYSLNKYTHLKLAERIDGTKRERKNVK